MPLFKAAASARVQLVALATAVLFAPCSASCSSWQRAVELRAVELALESTEAMVAVGKVAPAGMVLVLAEANVDSAGDRNCGWGRQLMVSGNLKHRLS